MGRRLGNAVGDALTGMAADIRYVDEAGGIRATNIIPTGDYAGSIVAYINGKRRGAYSSEPFLVPVPRGSRVYYEFFLASNANADEDMTRYLRTVSSDRARLDWTRAHADQAGFRVYFTGGLTATPDRAVATMALADRISGETGTAEFRYTSPTLPAGGYSWQIRPMDAAGNEKTGCASLTTVLAPLPQPPTGVEVHDYVPSTGLVTLKWSPASDAAGGSVYNSYRSNTAGLGVRYDSIVKTAGHGGAETGGKPYLTFALPVTGAAAEGTWLAGVRHETAEGEEDNVSAVAQWVVGADGSYATGYPRAPSLLQARAMAGGRIRLQFQHDNRSEPATTTTLRIFRGYGATPTTVDYDTVLTSVTRGSRTLYFGSASLSSLTEGVTFGFGIRAEAASGAREVNTSRYATATPDATPPTSCPTGATITPVIG